jgi:hypothetical protein
MLTELPDFPFVCKDNRVYVLTDMINCILNGIEFTDKHRESLKKYPNSIKLLEHFADSYKAGTAPKRIHWTPSPSAELEAFAEVALKWEDAIANGEYEDITPEGDSVYRHIGVNE